MSSVELTEAGAKRPPEASRPRMIERYPTLWSPDFGIGVGAGAGAGVAAALSAAVEQHGFVALLAIGGADVAVLGVVLVGVQLFISSLEPDYELALSFQGGIKGAIRPYLTVAAVAGAGAVVALVAAITWSLAPSAFMGVNLATAVLLTVWSVVGTVQLVDISVFHLEQRSNLKIAQAKAERARRSA